MVNIEIDCGIKVIKKFFPRLSRKSVYEIYTQVIKACISCRADTLENIIHIMSSSAHRKFSVIKTLNTYAYSVYSKLFHDFQFLFVDSTGIYFY